VPQPVKLSASTASSSARLVDVLGIGLRCLSGAFGHELFGLARAGFRVSALGLELGALLGAFGLQAVQAPCLHAGQGRGGQQGGAQGLG
jgi:hypothetical protein